MKYNYEKNIAEPMDITRQNKLPEAVTITIRHHESQAALVDFDIPLTEEQARQYVLLENDDERAAFLKEIVYNDPDIKSKLAREMLLAYKAQESREI